MLIIRNLVKSVVVAGAATGLFVAAPTAVISMAAPAPATDQVVLADDVQGNGGGDAGGGGGCGNGTDWTGCGGWNPIVGGWGSGCFNGICGGWDGFRGWGVG